MVSFPAISSQAQCHEVVARPSHGSSSATNVSWPKCLVFVADEVGNDQRLSFLLVLYILQKPRVPCFTASVL